MPDQFGAQGRAEQDPPVAGEAGDAGAGAAFDHAERRPGPLDLAGGGGEQGPGGGGVGAEHGGDLLGGKAVAYGEFQGLALLGAGPGRLRPGEPGQFGGAQLVGGAAALPGGVRRRASGLRLGQFAEADPAGQGVEPCAAAGRSAGGAGAVPCGEGDHLGQGGVGEVVVVQDREAVGEQAVQMGVVALPPAAVTAAWAGFPAFREAGARCALGAPVGCVGRSVLLLITRTTVGAFGGTFRHLAHFSSVRVNRSLIRGQEIRFQPAGRLTSGEGHAPRSRPVRHAGAGFRRGRIHAVPAGAGKIFRRDR